MKNYSSKFKIFTFLFLFAIFGFLFSDHALAAQVYFDPSPAQYQVGDSLNLKLYLDTEKESINAIDINILVPELLRIKNISKNGSFVQLWVNEPSFSGKTVNLVGGIPGGLTTAKGLVVMIVLEAAAAGEGNIVFLSSSSVLLNDGQGTKLDLKTAGGPLFKVLPKPKETATPVSELKERPETELELEKEKLKEEEKKEETKTIEKPDKKKPEKLEILFGKDPRVFGGENFISFFAVDADSGVDHYEVKLGKESFKAAKPPYLLKDVEPRTVIRVRAYDMFGNFAERVYPSLFKRIWWWIIKFF